MTKNNKKQRHMKTRKGKLRKITKCSKTNTLAVIDISCHLKSQFELMKNQRPDEVCHFSNFKIIYRGKKINNKGDTGKSLLSVTNIVVVKKPLHKKLRLFNLFARTTKRFAINQTKLQVDKRLHSHLRSKNFVQK